MGNKKSRNGSGDRREQTTKAIRRGEKFAKSLTQVVGQQDQSSPFQALLKSVETGLDKLRHYASGDEVLDHAPTSKKAKSTKKAKDTKSAKKAEPTATLPVTKAEPTAALPVTTKAPPTRRAKPRTPKKVGVPVEPPAPQDNLPA